ncbi:MAG TPA: hypothetical protein VL285_25190 [Bryobacteraceae bacterium]|jgi:hypothetical protein|nr:hypothetical protein [Bryobacteraceae bacterium]
MLFRYLRANFLFWFGWIFMAVGLGVLAITLSVDWQPVSSERWLTLGMVLLALCFLVPGGIFAGRQLHRARRAVTAISRGRYVVGRVEEIVPSNERLNGRLLYRVEWSWPGPDGKRRRAQSPSLSAVDATHWKTGDEIAAYIHPSDPEFAEADIYGMRP